MYRLLTAFFATLLAITHGKPVEQPTAVASEDYPRYAFHYAVKDPYSKDNKAQWEERDGDTVTGAYSLREPDGSLRVVEYSASDGSGFNAVVKNIGPNIHPVQVEANKVPVVSPVIGPVVSPVIGPVVSPVISPVTYGIPAGISVPKIGPIPVPQTILLGESSLPWDPITGSYGGWVPLSSGPRAFIISKKNVNGHLQKVIVGPISLVGKKITIRTKN